MLKKEAYRFRYAYADTLNPYDGITQIRFKGSKVTPSSQPVPQAPRYKTILIDFSEKSNSNYS